MSVRIEIPEIKRVVKDYDIIFESGMMMPVTIDETFGDKLEFTEDTIKIYLAAKPSKTSFDKLMPAEEITVFLKHVVTIQSRERDVVELTPDQKFDWQKEFERITAENSTKH